MGSTEFACSMIIDNKDGGYTTGLPNEILDITLDYQYEQHAKMDLSTINIHALFHHNKRMNCIIFCHN